MWTRKATMTLVGGISLILIGMMVSHFHLMILGMLMVSLLVMASWVSGYPNLAVERELSEENVYKGDDITVTLTISNRSRRRTQTLDIYDNVPHEMKIRRGINMIRANLGPGQSTVLRYTVRCPLRGHFSIGPTSLRYRDVFGLFTDEGVEDKRSDVIVFPQVRDIEDALLRSNVPKMYTGATTLRTPGQGTEFYSLREYMPGDSFRSINWKAFARTGDLMVNEKVRDAVTDVHILFDTRDISRIGTVLKNPLEMGAVATASISNHFIRRRDAVSLTTYGRRMDHLPAEAGDKQQYKILSLLAGVSAEGSMPIQAVTNALIPRMNRGSPVFVVSSLEGDGTALPAIRALSSHGHTVYVLSPNSVDLERLVSRIPRMAYEVLKMERQNRLMSLNGYGANVIDWVPDIDLAQALLQVKKG